MNDFVRYFALFCMPIKVPSYSVQSSTLFHLPPYSLPFSVQPLPQRRRAKSSEMSGNATATPRQCVVKAAPRLSASGNLASDANDDDQPVLMEARLVETITSLRQLIRSNEELEDALRDCPDDDLLEALKENEQVILRRRDNAMTLAAKLRRHGLTVSLEDKIPPYAGSSLLRQMKEEQKAEENDSGLYL
ncbi:hypothetical protein ACHAWF_008973 [Thalassiosira exigua]